MFWFPLRLILLMVKYFFSLYHFYLLFSEALVFHPLVCLTVGHFHFFFCVNFFNYYSCRYEMVTVSSAASHVYGNQLSEIIRLYRYGVLWESLIYFSCVINALFDPEWVGCVFFARDNWLKVFIQSFVGLTSQINPFQSYYPRSPTFWNECTLTATFCKSSVVNVLSFFAVLSDFNLWCHTFVN